MSIGIITGASRGLGLALDPRARRARLDARRGRPRRAGAGRGHPGLDGVVAVAGDVTDPRHRARLVAEAGDGIDLLVNNASALGPSPQPALAAYPLDELRRVLEVNLLAPLALVQEALPHLARDAVVVDVSSDAAVEAYPGWGGYGSSKAALDHLTAILATEHPGLRVYAVDPGDMRTQLHQEAFPGEDISDRPPPEDSVPGILALVEGALPSGRYRAAELARGARMTTIAFAEIAPATAPPEPRSDVSLLVATRADGAIAADALRRAPAACCVPATSSWSTPRRRSPPRCTGRSTATRCACTSRRRSTTDRWVVELRTAELGPLRPSPVAGDVTLPGGGRLTLAGPYLGSERLREADLALPGGTAAYLDRHGAPIRYADHGAAWPLSAYQTVFAREAGSAEMPSAGRPFTDALVTELVTGGVLVAPLVLHAGVSSPERDEPPFPERFRVPAETARLVGAVRGWGGRVIAVGTTVVRALESVALPGGAVRAGEGWTSLVVTPERGLRAVDGLITGWHEPRVLAPAHARGRRGARRCCSAPTTRPRRAGWPATSSATPC